MGVLKDSDNKGVRPISLLNMEVSIMDTHNWAVLGYLINAILFWSLNNSIGYFLAWSSDKSEANTNRFHDSESAGNNK